MALVPELAEEVESLPATEAIGLNSATLLGLIEQYHTASTDFVDQARCMVELIDRAPHVVCRLFVSFCVDR